MPIEVDAAQRLDELAEATLRVAERDGPGAITIRNVAAEFGGSTTVVTNYLATRSDLLLNVIRHAQRRWKEQLGLRTAGLSGIERFRRIAEWSCTTEDHDHAVRQIWLSLASQSVSGSAAHAALQQDAQEHRDELRSALLETTSTDPDGDADLIYLVLRGFYFVGVEDREFWNEDRVLKAVKTLTGLMVTDDEGTA